MKDLIDKVSKDIYIQTKNKYEEFIGKLNKLKIKEEIFLRLINIEKDEKDDNL